MTWRKAETMKRNREERMQKRKNAGKDKIVVFAFIGIVIIELILSLLVGVFWNEPLEKNEYMDVFHTLMGASMSVVFLGISMLNMLTDNSEKIYWVNDSERLMKKRPDFIALCRIGYISLGLQLISYIAVIIFGLPSLYAAFTMFFIDGLVSVIWIFTISTEAFSNKEKIKDKMKKEYNVADPDKQYEYYVRTIANFGDALKNGDTDNAYDNLTFLIENTLREDEKAEKRKKEFFKALKNVNDSEQLLFEPVFERVISANNDEICRISLEMLKPDTEKIWLGDKVADLLLEDIENKLKACDKKYEELPLRKKEIELQEKEGLKPSDESLVIGEELQKNALDIYTEKDEGTAGSSEYAFTEYFFKLKDLFLRMHRIDYAEKLIKILNNSKMPDFTDSDVAEESGKTIQVNRKYSKLTLCIHNEYGDYYDYSALSEKEKSEFFSILFPIVKKSWDFFENQEIPDYFRKSLQEKTREELNGLEQGYDHYDDLNKCDDREDAEIKKHESHIDECKENIRKALNILFKSSEESEYKGIVDDYLYLIEISGYMGENGKLIEEMGKYKFSYTNTRSLEEKENKKKSQDVKIQEWLKKYCENQKEYYSELIKNRG